MSRNWITAGLAACMTLSLLAMPARAVTEDALPTVTVSTEPLEPPAPSTQPSVPVPEEIPSVSETVPRPTLTTAHLRYMEGFPDGTLHPDGTLSRAQTAMMLYRLLSDQTTGDSACSYMDISSNDWFYPAVTKLYSLHLTDDGTKFRPNDVITRAELVDILARFVDAGGNRTQFPDVPEGHWAAVPISTAVQQGWIQGYADGTFRPDQSLTRAEACTILNRMMSRTGDSTQAEFFIGLGLYPDVSPAHWGYRALAEASIPHTVSQDESGAECWIDVPLDGSTFLPGFHKIQSKLYYVNRDGVLLQNTAVGAYTADAFGVLTQTATAYQMSKVPYHSQIDRIYALVGCEPTATLMGLQAKGFASEVTLRQFLDNVPRTTSDPEKGFVGSPYVPDTTKRTRTTIYPAILATYANSYCVGATPCSDIRGYTLEELQHELLAGNCVVAYMTLWWEKPYYRTYNIEGTTQRLVSNNHAVLVYGYDPNKGYLISDPYNYHNPNQVYQYWRDAKNFEAIWNARKVGMVIR